MKDFEKTVDKLKQYCNYNANCLRMNLHTKSMYDNLNCNSELEIVIDENISDNIVVLSVK